jgi:hypothetical protein
METGGALHGSLLGEQRGWKLVEPYMGPFWESRRNGNWWSLTWVPPERAEGMETGGALHGSLLRAEGMETGGAFHGSLLGEQKGWNW